MAKAEKNGRRREKFKPLPWIIGLGAVLLLTAAIFITAALKVYFSVESLKYKDGAYYDKKNDITYVALPMNYTYVLKAGERYARSDKHDLYRIGYKDDDKTAHLVPKSAWLTTDLSDGGVVYYNPDEIECPTSDNFDWDISYLCSSYGTTVITEYEFDANRTDSLLDVYFSADGEDNMYGETVGLTYKAELRVKSNTYKCLYMLINLYADDYGNYYLGSIYDQRMVKTDASLFGEIYGSPTAS